MSLLLRQALRVACLLIGLQIVFFAGLVAAQAVPDQPIVEHLVQSVEGGTYGASYAPDRMGGMSDTFTECVVVGTGLGAPPEESVWSRAIRMPRLSNCQEGAGQILDLAAGRSASSGDYFKYWAGYTVLTRPALATVGLEGLRILAGTAMVSAMALAFLTLRHRVGLGVAIAVLLPWLVGTNVLSTPSTSFSQSISITAIFGSLALGVWGGSRSPYLATVVATIGAAVFCYVDLLTTPAIPWVLTAFAAGAATWARTGATRPTLRMTALVTVVWPAAFAVTWVSRWVIAGAFLGPGYTWRSIRANVELRTGGAHDGISDIFGAGVATNIAYWVTHVPTWWLVLLGCLGATAIGVLLVVRRLGRTGLVVVAGLALPALVIPVWYVVLSNHSQLHEFFTSRGLPTILAVLAAASLAVAAPRAGPVSASDSSGDPARDPDQP